LRQWDNAKIRYLFRFERAEIQRLAPLLCLDEICWTANNYPLEETADEPLSSVLQLGLGVWYRWLAARGRASDLDEGLDDAVDEGLDGLGVG
jgi:hypothetical protein